MSRPPLLLLLTLSFLVTVSSTSSVRSSLRKSLFSGYDKLVNPDTQVTLNFGISVLDLGFCPHKQELSLRGWARNTWNDPRLTWKPSDWNGIKSLSLPTTELWMPDIALYNSVAQTEPNYVSWEKTSRVLLYSDGKVLFVPPITYRSFCNSSSVADGGGASQNCTLKIGSWVHSKEVLDIKPDVSQGGEAIDVSRLENGRVTIVSTDVTRTEPDYPCCPDDKYPLLSFTISFKSNTEMMMKSHKMGGSYHHRRGGHGKMMDKRKKAMKGGHSGGGGDVDSSEEEAENGVAAVVGEHDN